MESMETMELKEIKIGTGLDNILFGMLQDELKKAISADDKIIRA